MITNCACSGNYNSQGSFGKVHKGVLEDNTKVVVKQLTDYESPGGDEAFLHEVEIISVAVHWNLLRLIGFCTTPTERLLVYPYMQNLSVAYRLRQLKPGEAVLDWEKRKRVALGTTRGLEYLHEHCNPKVTPTRMLRQPMCCLMKIFEVVVCDFGLAKLMNVTKTIFTTKVRGTMGHIAPKYLSTRKASERTTCMYTTFIKHDTFVTRQRAIDYTRLEEEDHVLLDHVNILEREKRLDEIVDRNLNNEYNMQEVGMMIKHCCVAHGHQQSGPAMSKVVRMLEVEGVTKRWEELRNVEVTHRQEYNRMQRRFDWGEDSICNQDAIELFGRFCLTRSERHTLFDDDGPGSADSTNVSEVDLGVGASGIGEATGAGGGIGIDGGGDGRSSEIDESDPNSDIIYAQCHNQGKGIDENVVRAWCVHEVTAVKAASPQKHPGHLVEINDVFAFNMTILGRSTRTRVLRDSTLRLKKGNEGRFFVFHSIISSKNLYGFRELSEYHASKASSDGSSGTDPSKVTDQEDRFSLELNAIDSVGNGFGTGLKRSGFESERQARIAGFRWQGCRVLEGRFVEV
ncbi:LOW QUALITY PROTEIN: hypothetical protein OSB04_002310 [Centaurea solstitialis]|uniref:non-specific serine/threonine protein kinase n=1 Tax=Centaurea solstitialis TaxID=347529 RepID=A0AA38WUT4_9ASTR|nr:LOW QUALITY PROTEIN: hypothetical protein OSB04_002310 [Centaurea solstitialis]